MAWLEVEYLAVAPVPGTAAAENLAAVEPAYEDELIWLGDSERLAVCLLNA